jgi:hypothetical protein
MTYDKQDYSEYKDATICNIANGSDGAIPRPHIVYARIISKDGTLLMSAKLEQCAQRMAEAALANFEANDSRVKKEK